jgi:1,4-alpha-glucan branching enzyme
MASLGRPNGFLFVCAALAACADNARLLDAGTLADVPLEDDVKPAADVPVVVRDVAPSVDTPTPDALAATPDASTLGATATADGVRFRVWAPGAAAATVHGDFTAQPMTRGAGGVFEATAPDARPGHRYRYTFTRAGMTYERIDPRALELRDGMGVVQAPDTYAWRARDFRPPALRETVLYELHVGSFSVAPGEPHGTFASLTARLDALADLGVNAIELMPVNDFGSGTRWGYGPRHWFAVTQAYGSPDDLRRLVDEAHARGIAVVLDIVYNHYTGGRDAPLYCLDGDCADGTHGLYFFRDMQYRSTPWGPRPDFARTEVMTYLLDGAALWLGTYRMDGFRWDSVSNVRGIDGQGTVPGGRDLLVRGNALTRAMRPGAMVIAEDLKGNAAITRAATDGTGFGFDTQWDGFTYVMHEQLAPASDDARDLGAIRNALQGNYNGDPFARITGSENHDTVGNDGARFPQRVDARDPGSFAARKRSMLAAALALTAPGVPMLFMGQEHLEPGVFTPTPAPLDWSREEGHARVRAFYRRLVRMRRNLDGETPGLLGRNLQVMHFHDANKVVSFRRWDRNGDDVVVIANLRNRRYAQYSFGVPAGGAWRVRVDSDDPRWSTDFGGRATETVEAVARAYDNQPFTLTVPLGPWSVVVLSR